MPRTEIGTDSITAKALHLHALNFHLWHHEDAARHPGVGDREVARTKRAIDDLNAFAAAGMASDHEAWTADEARDRLRRGLFVEMRPHSLITRRKFSSVIEANVVTPSLIVPS